MRPLLVKYGGTCRYCHRHIAPGEIANYEYVTGTARFYCDQCSTVDKSAVIDPRAQIHPTKPDQPKYTVYPSSPAPVDGDTTAIAKLQSTIDSLSDLVSIAVAGTARLDQTIQQLSSRMSNLEQRMNAIEQQPKVIQISINNQGTGTIVSGVFHAKFPALVRLVSSLEPSERNVWLSGPAGSGKTTAARKLAEVLNLPFEFHGAIDSPYKLSGYKDAAGRYQPTSFRRIYEAGGVILLDECDASSPSALLELNAATSNSHASFPDAVIERHPDCYVLCAANTWGLGGDANYVGRARLDAAFLDRFVTIDWPYDPALERSLALDDGWTNVVQEVRRIVYSLGAQLVVSPRASIKGGQLLAGGCSRTEVVEAVFGRYTHHSAWSSISHVVDRWVSNG